MSYNKIYKILFVFVLRICVIGSEVFMFDGLVVHAYDKIYNEYYSKARDINYHKRMAKMYFKLFKKDFENDFKTISCSVSKYVYDNLPYTKSDFKFTLMNAQHVYAKCLFFNDWNDLRSFCEAN